MASKVTRRNPNALTATRRIAAELGKFRVRVGWAEDLGASPETVMIAAINALGAPSQNIPARDVITPLVRTQYPLIKAKLRQALRVSNRGGDPEPILQELADALRQLAKQAVRDFSDPPNAPSTIDSKGFDNPLVGKGADGGRLVAEVNAAVSKR